jgi:hypothetical protein
MTLLLLLVLALTATSTFARDCAFADDDIDCGFSESDGGMRLQYQSGRGTPMECKLQWTQLQERNTAGGSGGAVVNIIPLDSPSGIPIRWSQASEPGSQYSHDGEAHFQYRGQERVMEVHSYIGSADRDITVWPGQVARARGQQLKWTFRFRVNDSESTPNWAWQYGDEGELCVGVTMGCHSSEAERNQERQGMQAGTPQQCAGGPESPVDVGGRGTMVSAQHCYLNGNTTRAMNQTRIQYRQRAPNTYSFSWCFPHFTTEVIYDPTISLAPINTMNVGLIVGLSVAGAVLLSVAIGGAICYSKRRKAARRGVQAASTTSTA